ncbi:MULTISPECIES: S41 family peptidase [unclassified Oceanispirochaeta]|uniref:S41 family peptidase n=1 Tax=unclassified Oceanispirochaeta TaxID=2635722 RepID=UPI000E09D2BD|nr:MULTISPECIES: S41 family peptidase [unclassified Oceanispirochaeta]MBF9016394.1 hypothetical protein [Oceanispirochaeta sp. M2]NPD72856.1 hypothetical protein [Oceanispirochaeta sp. M1]RDG31700.1 hypothetical protein DV872_12160 [Oceanispirochaeta sp. M1]
MKKYFIKKSLMVTFLLFILMSCGSTSGAISTDQEYDTDHEYSISELKKDFIILRGALEEVHGGLYRYSSKIEMDALFDELDGSLDHGMTEREFLREVSTLVAQIGCGHTNVDPSEGFNTYWFQHGTTFPLDVKLIGDKVYVSHDYRESETELTGLEILTINEIPVADIIEKFVSFISSDGRNITGKYRCIDSYFPYLYSAFIGEPNTFNIKGKLLGIDEDSTFSVIAMTVPDLDAARNAAYNAEEEKVLDFQVLDTSSTAILSISSFDERIDSYKIFLKNSFNQIAEENISHLIIDLRGNGGGEDEQGALLFSYLTDTPFDYYDSLSTRTDTISFRQYFFGNIISDMTIQGFLNPAKNGIFQVKTDRMNLLNLQNPQKKPYNGNVYILTDGGSFSATTEFTSIAHNDERALFIGEEAGGGYYGNNSGVTIMLRLPNTGLEIAVPMINYMMAVSDYPDEDRGLIPDYPIEASIEDLLNGTDRVLEFTQELITSSL